MVNYFIKQKRIKMLKKSKKLILPILAVVFFSVIASSVMAVGDKVQQENRGGSENAQGPGNDSADDIGNEDGRQESRGSGDPTMGAPANISKETREHVNVVAQEVENLLTIESADDADNQGIGPQVKLIAQEQKRIQEQIKTQLNKLEARQGLAKKLFGPDYGAIKTMNKLMETNREKLGALTQLQTQVQSQTANQGADTQFKTAMQTALQGMSQQNTALQEQVQAEQQTKSMFGWLFRFFAK
ncbi:hypothetical protein KJ637_03025 [Patescibacteria group bacterium]|nr:hypothetical protein [Patescibacteria group bacterium]